MTSLLERAVGYALGSIDLVTPTALTHPTPCDEWNLQALLEHLNDSFAALHEARTTGRIALYAPIGGAQGLGGFGGARVGGVDGSGGIGRTDGIRGVDWIGGVDRVDIADRWLSRAVVEAVGALEIAVHGWDVAWACGVDRPIPDALAEELMALSRAVVGDRAGRFAGPVRPRVGAGVGERLVAFLGRGAVGHTAVPHPRP